MQTRLLLVAGALAVSCAAQDTAADPWQPHRTLEVLYAGSAGGTREKAFDAFLREHFDTVGVIALDQLTMASAAAYDVVIADWVSQYGNDGYPKNENSLHGAPGKLGPEFTKPVLAMSYVGTQVRAGYKLDWL